MKFIVIISYKKRAKKTITRKTPTFIVELLRIVLKIKEDIVLELKRFAFDFTVRSY